MRVFYERTASHQTMLVCIECERKSGNDPAAAALVTNIFDGPAIWAVCHGCGKKERIGSK